MFKSIIALALITGAASAHARPSTYNMTCNQAAALVQAKGAITMNYATSAGAGNLYERFVANGNYCQSGEGTAPAYVQTKDIAGCFIGYICERLNR